MAMSQRMWLREQERKRRERLKRARRRRNCTITVFFAAVVTVVIIVSRGCGGTEKNLAEPIEATHEPTTAEVVPSVADVEFEATVDEEELDLSCFENSAFVGNALAESFALYNLLPETDFYSGVNLDLNNVYTTASGYDSMAVADQLKSKKFSRVFLCFGERELEWADAARFGIEYRKLVEKVQEYQPSAIIYVISIPPVTKSVSNSSVRSMSIENIKEYNKRIRNMAYSEGLYYVDSVAALGRKAGYLNEGSSADGINLNKEYVIELINYIDTKAYIPKTAAADDEETDEDEELAETKPSESSETKKKEAEPEPTVNVFKDSAINDRD